MEPTSDFSRTQCWETTVVFLVSSYQYITVAFCYSRGPPFRKPIYTNSKLLYKSHSFIYLLQGEEQPPCVGRDAPVTVRHFLLEYGDFAQVRNNCFHVDNMKQLFQDIHIDSIITCLKEINLYSKI